MIFVYDFNPQFNPFQNNETKTDEEKQRMKKKIFL